jgi:hypothetical protein
MKGREGREVEQVYLRRWLCERGGRCMLRMVIMSWGGGEGGEGGGEH